MRIEEMIEASNYLAESVEKFIAGLNAEYAKPLVENDQVSPNAKERGGNIAKLRNEMQMDLYLWKMQTKSWRNSEEVKKTVQEYNIAHPESPITFDGDRHCINEHPGCRIFHKERIKK